MPINGEIFYKSLVKKGIIPKDIDYTSFATKMKYEPEYSDKLYSDMEAMKQQGRLNKYPELGSVREAFGTVSTPVDQDITQSPTDTNLFKQTWMRGVPEQSPEMPELPPIQQGSGEQPPAMPTTISPEATISASQASIPETAPQEPIQPDAGFGHPLGYIDEFTKAFNKALISEPLRGVAEVSRAALGAVGLPKPKREDDWLLQSADAVDKWVEGAGVPEEYQLTPEQKASFTGRLISGMGGVLPLVMMGMAKGAGGAAVSGLDYLNKGNEVSKPLAVIANGAKELFSAPNNLAAVQMIGNFSDEAIKEKALADSMSKEDYVAQKFANGADPKDAAENYDHLKNTTEDELASKMIIPGFAMAPVAFTPIGRLLSRFSEPTRVGIMASLKTGGMQALEQGIAGGIMNFIGNATAGQTYDKTRGLFDGLGESASDMAAMGAFLGFGAAGIKMARQKIAERVKSGEKVPISEMQDVQKAEDYLKDKKAEAESIVAKQTEPQSPIPVTVEHPEGSPGYQAAMDEAKKAETEATNVGSEQTEGTELSKWNPALKDAKSTAKALEEKAKSLKTKGELKGAKVVGEALVEVGNEQDISEIIGLSQKISEGFNNAGEQSKIDKSPKALGEWLISNAQTGDKIIIDEDSYWLVERKTDKKGNTEIELQQYFKNEKGQFENNPSSIKLFNSKHLGTDMAKLATRDASDLFETSYTNAMGDKVVDKSKYIPLSKNSEAISEAYHKAKADGSNPELVKAVEDLLTPKEGGQDANEFTSQGGNKIVDENGQPITLFHGTNKKFESFNDDVLGTFFTNDRTMAESYTKKVTGNGDSEPNVKEVKVSMKTPIVIDAKGKTWDRIDVETNRIEPEKIKLSINEILETVRGIRHPSIIHNLTFSKEKADGLIIKNVIDPLLGLGKPADVYIPFHNKQIKSIEELLSPKPENDAIQEQSTAEVPIRETPGSSEGIREGNAEGRETPKARQKEKGQAPEQIPVKSIRQLGTGSNVYFETEKYRVNDDNKGNVLLNIKNQSDIVPVANIKFDNANDAVIIAKEFDRVYPNGVPDALLIDKYVEQLKKDLLGKSVEPVKSEPIEIKPGTVKMFADLESMNQEVKDARLKYMQKLNKAAYRAEAEFTELMNEAESKGMWNPETREMQGQKLNTDAEVKAWLKDGGIQRIENAPPKLPEPAKSSFVAWLPGLNERFQFPKNLSKKVTDFLTKKIRPRGNMPSNLKSLQTEKEGEIGAVMKQIEFADRDLKRAVEKAYPNNSISVKDVEKLNDYLTGKGGELPAELYKPLDAMRDHIDYLSQKMIDEGVIDSKLVPVFDKNKGAYITRQYQIHNDPVAWKRYIEENPEGQLIRNKLVNFVQTQIDADANVLGQKADRLRSKAAIQVDPIKKQDLLDRADKYEIRAEELSNRDVSAEIDSYLWEHNAPLNIVQSGKLGAKDLGVLTKRKGVPAEWRALLGEVKDPLSNYAASVFKMGSLIANHRFLNDVRVEGLRSGLFSEGKPQGKNVALISAKGSETMKPLNGIYTTPEIAEVFHRIGEIRSNPEWLKNIMKANGLLKVGMTLYSPTTQVRNFGSNAIIELANAAFDYKKMKESAALTSTAFNGKMISFFDKKMTSAQRRERVLDLIKRGVLQEGANYNDIAGLMDDISSNGINNQKLIEPGIMKLLKNVHSTVKGLYRSGDDFWKVYAFENELKTLSEAYPDENIETLKDKAAEIVRKTRITYSLAPQFVKDLRKLPMMGMFITFPAEVARISYNIPEQAISEMKSDNKVIKAQGIKRMAGFIAAMAATQAIDIGTRAMLQMNDEDEEARRKFIAPWSQNSNLVWITKDKYVDMGFSDAFSYLKKPLTAFLRSDNSIEGIWNGIKQLVEPYISPEQGYKLMNEIAFNQNSKGRKIYDENMDSGSIASDIMKHAYTESAPGILKSIERIRKGITGETYEGGREFKTVDEIIAVLSGQRIVTMDWKKAYKSTLYAAKDDIDQLYKDYNKIDRTAPIGDTKSRQDRADKVNKAAIEIAEKFNDYYESAVKIGIDPEELEAMIKERKFPNKFLAIAEQVGNGEKEIINFIDTDEE